MVKNLFRLLVLIFLITITVLACKKSDNSAAYQTNLSVSNFVLNADSMSLLYDETPLFGNRALPFGSTTVRDSIAYLKPGAGVHEMKILVNGKLVKDKIFQAVAGKYHTLIAYDSLKADTIKSVLLEEAITVNDTVAQLRFINTIPGNDSLHMEVSRDTTIALTDVYIGLKSSPAYTFSTAVKQGNWTLKLKRGTTVVAQTDSFPMRAGKLYTIMAKGISGGTGLKAQGLSVLRHN